MKIKKLRITNYKGYDDSGDVELSDRFNVVVGQNNTGKSAFLQAFRFNRIVNHPHRNKKYAEGVPRPPQSLVRAVVQLEKGEMHDAIMKSSGSTFTIPIPDSAAEFATLMLKRMIDGEVLYPITSSGQTDAISLSVRAATILGVTPNSPYTATFRLNLYDQSMEIDSISVGSGESLSECISRSVSSSIYVFDAERYNIGQVPIEDTSVLAPNASNLPNVLAKMQKNSVAFGKYNKYVRDIFPSVKSVTVSQTGKNVEIFVYTTETERSDLAISLSESGTGVSQVLSILYVLMTMKRSVIVIDEPNSFLHPGASKKLMQIATLFDTHQFVISTHSPEIVSSIDPDLVLVVTNEEGESVISPVTMKEVSGVRHMLSELGSSFSDVFGLDNIIWVEGPTEAECFPAILRYIRREAALGTTFVPMRHTSDFDKKKSKAVEAWDLYKRISEGGSLVPPAVGFAFDREQRSPAEIEDLTRSSKGLAKFLPRRMYENYILDAHAVTELLASLLPEGAAPAQQNVEDALATAVADQSIAEVHGADILSEVISTLSGTLLEYRKVEHASWITRWLIEHNPESLAELADFVEKLVPREALERG